MACQIGEDKPDQIYNLARFELLRGHEQPAHLCRNFTFKVAKNGEPRQVITPGREVWNLSFAPDHYADTNMFFVKAKEFMAYP